MDYVTIGSRITSVRETAQVSQEALARVVGLDRTAISRIESGDRRLGVTELIAIADALRTPLSYFVAEPVAAVVSRRTDTIVAESSTRELDQALEQWAQDVRTLVDLGLLHRALRPPHSRVPRTHEEAEGMAQSVRRVLGLGNEPIEQLADVVSKIGLLAFSTPLGHGGPDGACVVIDEAPRSLAAAIINGDQDNGRRRMTLAHELGHWLAGDAYDREADILSEPMINSFAIHLLAPRGGVTRSWRARTDLTIRERAITVAADYRLSWSAAVSQLRNLDLISHEQRRSLASSEPKPKDYAKLNLRWPEDLEAPFVPAAFRIACVDGYVTGVITEDRAIELLRGAMPADQLPKHDSRRIDDYRPSFQGHDG